MNCVLALLDARQTLSQYRTQMEVNTMSASPSSSGLRDEQYGFWQVNLCGYKTLGLLNEGIILLIFYSRPGA